MARTKTKPSSGAPICTWMLDPDPDCESWDTSCGEKFVFMEGGPAENHVRFCCYCGGRLRAGQGQNL